MKRLLFILLLIPYLFAACVPPAPGMSITSDTEFCPGVYYLDRGITINSDGVSVVCDSTILIAVPGSYAERWEFAFNSNYKSDISISGCVVANFSGLFRGYGGREVRLHNLSFLRENDVMTWHPTLSFYWMRDVNVENVTIRYNLSDYFLSPLRAYASSGNVSNIKISYFGNPSFSGEVFSFSSSYFSLKNISLNSSPRIERVVTVYSSSLNLSDWNVSSPFDQALSIFGLGVNVSVKDSSFSQGNALAFFSAEGDFSVENVSFLSTGEGVRVSPFSSGKLAVVDTSFSNVSSGVLIFSPYVDFFIVGNVFNHSSAEGFSVYVSSCGGNVSNNTYLFNDIEGKILLLNNPGHYSNVSELILCNSSTGIYSLDLFSSPKHNGLLVLNSHDIYINGNVSSALILIFNNSSVFVNLSLSNLSSISIEGSNVTGTFNTTSKVFLPFNISNSQLYLDDSFFFPPVEFRSLGSLLFINDSFFSSLSFKGSGLLNLSSVVSLSTRVLWDNGTFSSKDSYFCPEFEFHVQAEVFMTNNTCDFFCENPCMEPFVAFFYSSNRCGLFNPYPLELKVDFSAISTARVEDLGSTVCNSRSWCFSSSFSPPSDMSLCVADLSYNNVYVGSFTSQSFSISSTSSISSEFKEEKKEKLPIPVFTEMSCSPPKLIVDAPDGAKVLLYKNIKGSYYIVDSRVSSGEEEFDLSKGRYRLYIYMKGYEDFDKFFEVDCPEEELSKEEDKRVELVNVTEGERDENALDEKLSVKGEDNNTFKVVNASKNLGIYEFGFPDSESLDRSETVIPSQRKYENKEQDPSWLLVLLLSLLFIIALVYVFTKYFNGANRGYRFRR